MSSQSFANESPAYAVLYRASVDDGWTARIVDLDSLVVTGSLCNLTKAPEAYAVLYTPQPDGKWLADIVDLPGCNATRPEIAQARIAAKALVQKALVGYKKRGESAPSPATFCYYTRPTDLQLNPGPKVTIVDEVAEAVANLVARHRSEHGTTPRASSVCGYVTVSSDSNEGEPSSPE